MSQDSRSYEEKKRSSIVHKPFLKGTINLFNPPKKNPNGHLASARQAEKDIAEELSTHLATEEELPEFDPSNKIPESTGLSWLNGWRISAILLVLAAHTVAAVAIMMHRRQQIQLANVEVETTRNYSSGKTDLTQSEFTQLTLEDLKNVAPTKSGIDNQLDIGADLPLAIPPSNLPNNIVLPKINSPSKYYYILAQYTGDRSLELAKSKVPNVSLVNFPQGVFLYLGAFTVKETANNFIQELKQIGLESYVYPAE